MKVMNGLVITHEEDEIFMCLAVLLCDSRTEVPRCKMSIKSSLVLFHEIIFFCRSDMLGEISSICRVQLARLGKKREETMRPVLPVRAKIF